MANNPFQQFPPTFRQGPEMGNAGAMRPNPIPDEMFGNFPQMRGRRQQPIPQKPTIGQHLGGPGGDQTHFTGAGQPPQKPGGGQSLGGPGGYQTGFTGNAQPPGGNPFLPKGGSQVGGPGGYYGGSAGPAQPPQGGGSFGPGYLWGEGAENPFLQFGNRAPRGTGMSYNPIGGAIGGPTQMGASDGSWNNPFSGMNFNIPMPSPGMVGGAMGGMFGGLPGAFLGNRAGNWLSNRFGWGQGGGQSSGPSPFMPSWLGGSGGETTLGNGPMGFGEYEGGQRDNITANLPSVGPDGQPMTGLGSYRSRAGNVTGQINPDSFVGMIDPVGGNVDAQQVGQVGNSWLRR